MLNQNNILWSKGFIRNNYSKQNTEKISNKTEIINIINNINSQTNTPPVIFIRMGSHKINSDLDIFSNNLNKLNQPCILITTDGDRLVPSSYNLNTVVQILNNKNIIKWLTQNYDKTIIHDKLKHYPIGFDLHTTNWLINNSIQEKINFMIQIRNNNPTHKRIKYKIFSDSHVTMSHKEREIIYNLIKNNNLFKLSKNKQTFYDITKIYNTYNFVLSPRGNGLDCHRTWELFLAGCIVITKTSPLDDMYLKHNLPVVILNNWTQLNNITQNTLNKWHDEHIVKTDINNIFPKLTYNYWL